MKIDDDIIDAYGEKFGEVPTLRGLRDDLMPKAMQLLTEAIQYDSPFSTDAEFYEALGVEPPPEGAET